MNPYVFVPGSVPLESADRSPPISRTSLEAAQVIMTIEYTWETNNQFLAEQRGRCQ